MKNKQWCQFGLDWIIGSVKYRQSMSVNIEIRIVALDTTFNICVIFIWKLLLVSIHQIIGANHGTAWGYGQLAFGISQWTPDVQGYILTRHYWGVFTREVQNTWCIWGVMYSQRRAVIAPSMVLPGRATVLGRGCSRYFQCRSWHYFRLWSLKMLFVKSTFHFPERYSNFFSS